MASEVRFLEGGLKAFLRQRLGATWQRFMVDWPVMISGPDPEPSPLPPVTQYLPGLLSSKSAGDTGLVGQLSEAADKLHWRQSYSEADFGPEFIRSYAYVELVGKRSALSTGKMAAGLLMFGPDVVYPEHRHAAEELYVPVAGSADFLMPDGSWRPVESGGIVHNAPWVSHGIRTDAQPVLIAWLWLGGDPAVRSEILQTAL